MGARSLIANARAAGFGCRLQRLDDGRVTSTPRTTPRADLPLASTLLASVLAACALLDGGPPPACGKPNVQASVIEEGIYALINRERAAKNVARLQLDATLSRIARAHSADMLRRKYFSHVDPDGNDPSERGRRAGFECRRQQGRRVTLGLAENIYQTASYDRITFRDGVASYDWNTAEEIAASTVDGWMKSRGHRENILQVGPTVTGIGVAIAPDGKIFVTQLFC